jgi:ufm1-conjugating enzyme 1
MSAAAGPSSEGAGTAAAGGFDAKTVATVQKLPLLSVRTEDDMRGERSLSLSTRPPASRPPPPPTTPPPPSLLQETAGPRDAKDKWEARLKQVCASPHSVLSTLVAPGTPPRRGPARAGRSTTPPPSPSTPPTPPLPTHHNPNNHNKQELQALIQYVQQNKAADSDWFTIAPETTPPAATSSSATAAPIPGLRWAGRCWYVHNYVRHEFAFRFDVPATYPASAPEIEIPELEGKTAKMYRGGKICTTVHFKPLWSRNSPHFGLAHALCLGLAPWLAAEVPFLVDSRAIVAKH